MLTCIGVASPFVSLHLLPLLLSLFTYCLSSSFLILFSSRHNVAGPPHTVAKGARRFYEVLPRRRTHRGQDVRTRCENEIRKYQFVAKDAQSVRGRDIVEGENVVDVGGGGST